MTHVILRAPIDLQRYATHTCFLLEVSLLPAITTAVMRNKKRELDSEPSKPSSSHPTFRSPAATAMTSSSEDALASEAPSPSISTSPGPTSSNHRDQPPSPKRTKHNTLQIPSTAQDGSSTGATRRSGRSTKTGYTTKPRKGKKNQVQAGQSDVAQSTDGVPEELSDNGKTRNQKSRGQRKGQGEKKEKKWTGNPPKAKKVLALELESAPMNDIQTIFTDLTQKAVTLGFREVINHLGTRNLKVATMCSGTEAPILALRLMKEGQLSHQTCSTESS